jgi:hypothetical protein
VLERVGAIQRRYQALRADDAELERILANGAERAAAVSQKTLDEVLRLTGLR